MLLNRLEYALMNSPLRAALLRRYEAPRLLRMGGALEGGRALEVGCGSGRGTEIVLDLFRADAVDAFDLDPRMAARARRRLAVHGSRARVWVGDVCGIGAADATYDAVFDFGMVHHVADWRRGLAEISRVLKPGGRLYAEEVLDRMLLNPLVHRLFDHPCQDRFDAVGFARELESSGVTGVETEDLWGWFAWFTGRREAGKKMRPAP